MDFELSPEQEDVLAAVNLLLERKAGPERAREVLCSGGYDAELMAALTEAGFADFASGGAGPLESVLTAERIAVAAGCIPYATRALVAPALLPAPLPELPVVLPEDLTAPVRFAAQADAFLAARGGEVVRLEPAELGIEPVDSPFRFPFARVEWSGEGGEVVEGASPADLLRYSRVALAAEMVGCMEGSLGLTVPYLADRHQFGRPIGSFQAVQHRLAELHVRVDSARWLTRQAAWAGAPAEQAAVAATAASEAAALTVSETHQLTGAMGLTEEYDLHLWTMRLAALRLELGGVAEHSAAAGAPEP